MQSDELPSLRQCGKDEEWSDLEQSFVGQVILVYGSDEHPYPDHDTLPHFTCAYVSEMLHVAMLSGELSEEGQALAEKLHESLEDCK